MAKPSTRQELIDYCLRRLGAPVLEINVDDEQIDDLVDDAIQYYNERHFDGVERMYLKYELTQDDIDSQHPTRSAGQPLCRQQRHASNPQPSHRGGLRGAEQSDQAGQSPIEHRLRQRIGC